MAPRITIHSSVSTNNSSRTWPAPDQRAEQVRTNGQNAEIDVDEGEELVSDLDEASMEEVDELDESDGGEKDAQPQWETISSTSAAGAPSSAAPAKAPVKRSRPKPPTTRIPGQTIVPMPRVEAILSMDSGQHGTAAKETSFLISLATEEFIRRLTRAAHSRSRLDGRSLTSYNDIADTAYYFEEYAFLQEMIPRPIHVKTAFEGRKRILEEQEALLHGVGVNGADSASTNHYKMEESSTSADSTPIPRLTKKVTPSTSANGKTSARSKNVRRNTSPPVVRSERQKSKKARLAAEAQAAADAAANGTMAPPPSPAVKGRRPEDNAVVNGSNPSGQSGTRIKIRLASTAARSNMPDSSASQPPIPPLGPPSKSPSITSSESRPSRSRSHSQHHNGENINAPLVIEQDSKSGVANSIDNGQLGNVQFAPIGIAASDQPLWTRVPLPPPPSAKVGKTLEDAKSKLMLTDLDSTAEQAKTAKTSRARFVREHEDVPLNYPQDELNLIDDTNGLEPPAKKSRQRQRSGDSTSSKGNLREVLNGSFPSTGRTIYSRR